MALDKRVILTAGTKTDYRVMSLLEFKILAAATIFLIAMIGGILPLHVIRNHKKALALGDAFASGIFWELLYFTYCPKPATLFESFTLATLIHLLFNLYSRLFIFVDYRTNRATN
ncbi:MAG: hypothetical protein HWD59_11400 [Coxiellaceae bacterium]|nr:MAG: hypothetical protein HWD59_11400 [Coxiellaceae bacterium]